MEVIRLIVIVLAALAGATAFFGVTLAGAEGVNPDAINRLRQSFIVVLYALVALLCGVGFMTLFC